MVRSSGLALAAVALLILCVPAASWADVIPSRRATAKPDATPVHERMVTLGVCPSDAGTAMSGLTPADAAFFTRHGDGVQIVAGLTLEEWVIGGSLALLILVTLFWVNQRTPK